MTHTTTPRKPMPPAPKGHWFWGNVVVLLKDPFQFFRTELPRYNGLIEITSKVKNIMICYEPDMIKHVLQDNNRNYTKSFGYRVLMRLLGQGLLTSEGDFWRRQRRLAQPAFHRKKLNNMVATMAECTQDIIDALEQHPKGQPVNISKAMMEVTLNIVARAMFSSDVKDVVQIVGEDMEVLNEAAMERIRNPFKLPDWVPTPKNLTEERHLKRLKGVVMDIIRQRRKTHDTYDDLLQMLMDAQDEETGESMTDEQLLDECMTIFLAGHETTALGMTYLLYLMHHHPEEEAKVVEEARRVLGDTTTPSAEEVMQLTYTRQVIDETLRLYPPVYVVGRCAVEDDDVGGYRIPKGYNVLIPTWWVHRDPKLWDEPETFRPVRFEKEQAKQYHKYQYFPFGGGPRLCIGNNFALMEMQVITTMLLRRFHFRLADDYQLELDTLITMRPKQDVMMYLEERK